MIEYFHPLFISFNIMQIVFFFNFLNNIIACILFKKSTVQLNFIKINNIFSQLIKFSANSFFTKILTEFSLS